MGIIHKLKPEVVEFILSAKKEDPRLSCRKLVPLLKRKLGVNVSKSSVNSILKGTTSSSKASSKRSPETEILIENAGAFFLKGADMKMRATFELTEAVKGSIKDIAPVTLQAYNEALVYLPLFGIKNIAQLTKYQGQGLWALSGLKYDSRLVSSLTNYYNVLSDRKLYYSVALRLVSLYTNLVGIETVFSQEENIQTELNTLLLNLNKYAQKEFFSSSYRGLDLYQMQQQVYSLTGALRRSRTSLIIQFNEYKSMDVQMEISQACRSFNNSSIQAASGQKLYIQPLI